MNILEREHREELINETKAEIIKYRYNQHDYKREDPIPLKSNTRKVEDMGFTKALYRKCEEETGIYPKDFQEFKKLI